MAQNEKINFCKEKPLLLFSPLDWGLGHTTRCIPLLKEWLRLGCSVIVACNSTQRAILKPEFPEITFETLTGYGFRYRKNRLLTRIFTIFQLPKILIKINNERRWIRRFVARNPVDAVISDNRYGFFMPGIPSYFITHQLQIRTGWGRKADQLAQSFAYKQMTHFSECWAPDFSGHENAAGSLSHPVIAPPIPVTYLGCLSRFVPIDTPQVYDRLIILSGPEPQRRIFEDLVFAQLKNLPGKSVVVRALPGISELPPAETEIRILNHASSAELNTLICGSALVISRSGYTTVMDLLKLKKKMILVPTPGQPEQEYLASWLQQQKLVFSMNQEVFSIAEAEQRAADFDYRQLNEDMEQYKKVMKSFVAAISS